jgi:hypothetical protein
MLFIPILEKHKNKKQLTKTFKYAKRLKATPKTFKRLVNSDILKSTDERIICVTHIVDDVVIVFYS